LLPHVEVVKSTTIEFEGNTTNVMEHNVRAKHVSHVGQGPRSLLGDAGDNVVEDLEGSDENDVNGPGSYDCS
jgi:hypothetical protein